MKTGHSMRLVIVAWAVITCCVAGGAGQALAQGDTGQVPSDLVTLNVDEGQITQVLNAFSRQTGRSIVLGPEVQGKVTARLSNVQWRDALDAILKPYGYGYYMVGDTIIIGAADKIQKPSATPEGTNAPGATSAAMQAPAAVPPPPEPMTNRIIKLKYLDVRDVEQMIERISPNTKVGRLLIQSQTWDERAQVSQTLTTTSSESLGRLGRTQERAELVRSKTIVLVDTRENLDRVERVIASLDVPPNQVQIEAKFVEVRSDLLRDIGMEWGTGANGASAPGVKTIGTTGAGNLYAAGAQQISGTLRPAGFDPQSTALASARPFNGGLSLAFQKLTDMQFEVLMHLLQEDASYNMLSSPRVLALDNQDAVIIVGQKLPIIKSDASGAGTTTTISTSLERYEDVGIKLKVLPQICEDNFINLVVHPSVRELLGFQSGKVGAAGEGAGSVVGLALTEYPVVATREAETQVLVKSGETIVIGGMIRDKKTKTEIKVPVLGSIPLLGVLFRRETVDNEKIELLIFLTAKIVKPGEDGGGAIFSATQIGGEGMQGGTVAAP